MVFFVPKKEVAFRDIIVPVTIGECSPALIKYIVPVNVATGFTGDDFMFTVTLVEIVV